MLHSSDPGVTDVTYFELALKNGHAEIAGKGKQQKVTYKALSHTERYFDPEEAVTNGYDWKFGLLQRQEKHIMEDTKLYRIPEGLEELV